MAGNETESPEEGRAVGDLSYTEASRELDDIVRFFEQREVDVDQLVGRLERATAIVDELDRRLRRTRTQVEELVPRLAAVLSADGAADDEAMAPDEAIVEDELEQADNLAEVMEDAVEPVFADDGDPGPSEPSGLF